MKTGAVETISLNQDEYIRIIADVGAHQVDFRKWNSRFSKDPGPKGGFTLSAENVLELSEKLEAIVEYIVEVREDLRRILEGGY